MTDKPLHPAAAIGFDTGAATYVAGRPDYPDDALSWLIEDLGLGAGRVAVDLGAGSGKFIPWLRRTGANVIAVEPVAGMRDELRRAFPALDVREGRAQALPLMPETADAIVCAQAFHWFATREALAEIRRVLVLGGRLGLIWNVRDETVPWVAELTRLIAPFEGDAPRYASGNWRAVFPAEGFTPLTERAFPHAHVGPPERVIVDRVLSTSFIAALPATARANVASEVRKLIAATPDLAGREMVAFPYVTRAYGCRRTG